MAAQDSATNNAYQPLANMVILVSLPIAGCTLAAGIAAGLADRKRPFSLMRLTGVRLASQDQKSRETNSRRRWSTGDAGADGDR